MKVCTKCAECLPLDRFYRNPAASDGLRTDCKTCHDISHKPKQTKGLRTPFTTGELKFIALHYDRLGPTSCALHLRRSADSVKSKRWAMNKESA